MSIQSNQAVNPTRPIVRVGEHPIESGRYLLETPAVLALFAQVIQWINNRIPGAIIHGRPRRGKSKGMFLLMTELARVFPGMPVVFLPQFARTVPKDDAFLSKLLKEAGHMVVETGDVEDKLERLVEFLALKADVSGQNRAVLIVDEAQMFHECHFNWLIGIHNELDRRGVNFIVLLVGQHQLLQTRTRYIAAEKHEIVGRFMVHVEEFHGVQSSDDVKECLQAYDDVAEYPIGSGWSYTRYYLTEWFAEGGRLANLADDIWSVLTEVRKGGKLQADKQIPMQDFARSIDHFLRVAAGVDEKTRRRRFDLGLPNDVRVAMHEALAKSGYLSALKLNWSKDK